MSELEKRHYVELDGLRGVAIALVLVIHFLVFEPWSMVDRVAVTVAGAGWVGVDVFFVLSGFLITGILYDTRRSSRYFSTFFLRRCLRIFPLYFAYVAAVAAVAFVVAPSTSAAGEWRTHQWWYWTYTVNLLAAYAGSWDVLQLETGHLWSLAIEEQFYLFWPLVVWKAGRHRLAAGCMAAIGAVALLRVAARLGGINPVAIFASTPTRIDALLAGALIALAMRGGASDEGFRRAGSAALWCGAAGTLLAFGSQLDSHGYGPLIQTVGFPAITAVSAGLVMHAVAGDPDGWLRRMLRSRALVTLGGYSYGLYMLHQAAEAAVIQVFPDVTALPTMGGIVLPWVLLRAVCSTALALGAAYASWHLFEKHFLALKPDYPESRQVSAGRAGPAALRRGVARGLRGRRQRRGFLRLAPDAIVRTEAARCDIDPLSGRCMKRQGPGDRPGRECMMGADGFERVVALWGDPHADSALGVVAYAARRGYAPHQLAMAACLPLADVDVDGPGMNYGPCREFNRNVRRYLTEDPRADIVMLTARWPLYTENSRFGNAPWSITYLLDAGCLEWSPRAPKPAFSRALAGMSEELQMAGKRVVVLGTIPPLGVNIPECLARNHLPLSRVQDCGAPADAVLPHLEFADSEIERLTAERPGVCSYRPVRALCVSGRCRDSAGDQILYANDDHLSVPGRCSIPSTSIWRMLRGGGSAAVKD